MNILSGWENLGWAKRIIARGALSEDNIGTALLREQSKRANLLSLDPKKFEHIKRRYLDCIDLAMRIDEFLKKHPTISTILQKPLPNSLNRTTPFSVLDVTERNQEQKFLAWLEAIRSDIEGLIRIVFQSNVTDASRMNIWHTAAQNTDKALFYQKALFYLAVWKKYPKLIWFHPFAGSDEKVLIHMNILMYQYCNGQSLAWAQIIGSSFAEVPEWGDEKLAKKIPKIPSTYSVLWIRDIDESLWVDLLEEYLVVKSSLFTEFRTFSLGMDGIIDEEKFSMNMEAIWHDFFIRHYEILNSWQNAIADEVLGILGPQFYDHFLHEVRNEKVKWKQVNKDGVKAVSKKKTWTNRAPSNRDFPKVNLPAIVSQNTLPPWYKFGVPNILSQVKDQLSRWRWFRWLRESVAKGIPYSDHAVLWIFAPRQDGEWSWKNYDKRDMVELISEPDFPYRFVLTGWNSDKGDLLSSQNYAPFQYAKKVEDVRCEVPGKTVHILEDADSERRNQALVSPASTIHPRALVGQTEKPRIPWDRVAENILNAIINEVLVVTYDELQQKYIWTFTSDGILGEVVLSIATQELSYTLWGKLIDLTPELKDLYDLAQEYLTKKWEVSKNIAHQERIESQKELLRSATSYTQEVLLWAKWKVGTDDISWYGEKLKNLRIWDRYCGIKFIGSIYEGILREKLIWFWLHIKFFLTSDQKNIKISLSFAWSQDHYGSVESIGEKPYHIFTFPAWIPEWLRDDFQQTLSNLLEILWIAWKTFYHNDWSIRIRIRDIIEEPGKYNPYNDDITVSAANKVQKRFSTSEGKVLMSRYDKEGRRYFGIRTWIDIRELQDDTLIVIHDDVLASTNDAYTKWIYTYIRWSERLKKYLILRVMATIKWEIYHGKGELTGSMKTVFEGIWDSLSQVEQDGLTDSINKSAGTGANFKIWGMVFIDKLLAEYERHDVGILYRSPKYVPWKIIEQKISKI